MQSLFRITILVMLIFASSFAGNINVSADHPAIQPEITQDEQGGRFGAGFNGLRANMLRSHKKYRSKITRNHRIDVSKILTGIRRLVPQDYATIQAAIDSSAHGDTVLVSDGTYLENIRFRGKAITVASLFLIDGDTSHIDQTIIDGSNPSHPDSASVVYFINGEDTTSVLCGFTIKGGSGTSFTTPNGDEWQFGGGIFSMDAFGATIKNNYITKNNISGDNAWGGGVFFFLNRGFVILDSNYIFGNRVSANPGHGWGGGVGIDGDTVNAHIVGNVFERDTVIAQGYAGSGALDISGRNSPAEGVISNNVFRDNYVKATNNNGLGGAFTCYYTAALEIRDNLFEGNIAISQNGWAEGGAFLITDEFTTGYGRKLVKGNRFINNLSSSSGSGGSGAALELFRTFAIVYGNYFEQNTAQGGSATGGAIQINRSAFSLENNICAENSATNGGAVYVTGLPQSGSGMDFINNTIFNNNATSTGGGIRVTGVQVNVKIINSILWGNSPNQIATASGGSVNVRYSDVQGGWPGEGNINENPLFADITDYNLSDSSFCIGAGIDSIQIGGNRYYAPPFDFDGDPRPNPSGSMPDIGAQENPLSLPDQYILVPQNYSTIQAGINAASDGETVIVADGTYLENIDFKGKAITVASYYILDGDTNHINNTIIDGSQSSNPDSGSVVYFVSGEDTNSVLSGFTITGGTGTPVTPRIMATARGGGGILCLNSDARIKNNRIINNSVDDPSSLEAWGGGIYSYSDTLMSSIIIIEENTIQQNTVNADTAALGAGIYANSNARIMHNLITENVSSTPGYSQGGGISVRDYFDSGNSINVTGNTITDNQAVSSNYYGGQGGGLDILWIPHVIIKNNIISHNKSGGSGVCWASGLMVGWAEAGSVIEDNTISNNSASSGDLSATFFLHECTGLTVQRNLLQNNSAYWSGGIRNDYGEGNIISDNHLIENNAHLGGGIYLTSSTPMIQNNLIARNTATYGGGIQIFNPTRSANFKANQRNKEQTFAHGGALKDTPWNGNILRNSKAANSSRFVVSKPVIINNTIVDNTASTRGGAIRTNDSNPVVINSILWGNDAPSNKQISFENGSIEVRYSDIQGSWPGEGNIDVDLFFEDTGYYQLSDSSLCIGAGIDSIQLGGVWYYTPPFDFDGDPRPNPVDMYVDIGAQESPYSNPTGIKKGNSDYLPKTFALKQNYPNPFNPTTTIEFSIPKSEFVTLKIYNILGQQVATLVSEKLAPGNFMLTLDANSLASGVYYYKIEAGNYTQTRKLILMK
jgi:hypothetical protein